MPAASGAETRAEKTEREIRVGLGGSYVDIARGGI